MGPLMGRLVLGCTLACFCLTSMAADDKSTSTKKTTAKKTQKKDELTGRLPRHFASLVDEKQRAEIYEVQASYRVQIEELEKKLLSLRTAEMAAMEKVLTATQRKKLATLRSGEKKSTTAKTAKRTKSAATPKSTSASKKTTSKK